MNENIPTKKSDLDSVARSSGKPGKVAREFAYSLALFELVNEIVKDSCSEPKKYLDESGVEQDGE